MAESGVMHQDVEENGHKTLREENVTRSLPVIKMFVLRVNLPLNSEIIFGWYC